MWVGGYVTFIFLVHPKTLLLDRPEHAKIGPENLTNNFSDALAILNSFFQIECVSTTRTYHDTYKHVTWIAGVPLSRALPGFPVTVPQPLNAVMRASPSTCRVLTIDWRVRGLYRCLWYAHGLCLCPCVIAPTVDTIHGRYDPYSKKHGRYDPYSKKISRYRPSMWLTPRTNWSTVNIDRRIDTDSKK